MSILISFLPFILIMYYVFSMRKRELISWYILHGFRCYQCKEEFKDSNSLEFYKLSMEEQNKTNLRLCVSCQRERGINILFNKNREEALIKLRKFVLTKKYTKFQQLFTIFCLVLPLSGLVLDLAFGIKAHLSEVSAILNCFIWTLMIFHMRTTTIPKIKKPR